MNDRNATDEGDQPDRVGIVLAGGDSSRFGEQDKALATIGETTMLERVVTRISKAVDEVVVSCHDGQVGAFERALADGPSPAYVTDPEPGQGPLVGLRAALGQVDAPYAAVVACDMPAVDPTFLAYLFDVGADCDGAIPRLRDDHLQPMQAVYRSDGLLDACEQRLDAGDQRLLSAVDSLDIHVVDPTAVAAVTDWRSLTNINTQRDLASLARRLDG